MLEGYGYRYVRTVGSHVRMLYEGPPEHRVSIPLHASLRTGTLNAILTKVANHLKITKSKLIQIWGDIYA
ncbi:MAG TPA: type II toxin-antitoxin system HicA family toxin [bacterium]